MFSLFYQIFFFIFFYIIKFFFYSLFYYKKYSFFFWSGNYFFKFSKSSYNFFIKLKAFIIYKICFLNSFFYYLLKKKIYKISINFKPFYLFSYKIWNFLKNMNFSPNKISILLGGEGLGLVSYCLEIYYQNIKSYNAGMLTALSNRIGDVMILILISWMLNYGSWNYIFYLNFMNNEYSMKIISLLLVIAAMTKSAQIPFSSWLPAAMAAPTPVSALVHSSTLVTAGVYLLIRFNNLLIDMFFFKFLLLFSGLTMMMAGISANYEFDLKKIIALSTLSQLGLMMSILSMGFYDLAFFHLLTHAMFKALLFMCAGVIIHMMNDNQDIRVMGGINLYIPLTSLCLNISNMALCGIPFLAGFYSKDLILEMVSMSNLNLMIFYLYYFSTGLTMFYTIRLLMYLMVNDYNLGVIYNLYDEDYVMLKSMMILLMMSLISGSFLSWMIFYYPYMIYLPFSLKMMVIYVIIMGLFMGYMVSNMNIYSLNKVLMTYNLSYFFVMMWFLPSLSTYGLNYYFLNFSQKLFKIVDLGWSEYYSGQGVYNIIKYNSVIYYVYQMNNFKIYLFSFILWMLFMIMVIMI
uniref:NADH-ubiquinone oxidoreductase chain 5 n=1 Tax=Telchinia issoria TaxID=2855149 RepID=D2IT15_9NEOP|nr:NADH dehydrogenase subunit 5 [Telchinia issoria]ACT83180.1 NADH dehydrogenase subunit 5 [Telchinia issoria]